MLESACVGQDQASNNPPFLKQQAGQEKRGHYIYLNR
jgi:hypothetical protein